MKTCVLKERMCFWAHLKPLRTLGLSLAVNPQYQFLASWVSHPKVAWNRDLAPLRTSGRERKRKEGQIRNESRRNQVSKATSLHFAKLCPLEGGTRGQRHPQEKQITQGVNAQNEHHQGSQWRLPTTDFPHTYHCNTWFFLKCDYKRN